MSTTQRVTWPEGKDFAFTIFDDTDQSTLANVGPVYEFLADLGMRTTKSVWPLEPLDGSRFQGSSCEDAEYLAWTLELQARGFEIGCHGPTASTTPRERVIAAFDRFRELYGHDPYAFANHPVGAESIYWGADRVSGINRWIYRGLTLGSAASRTTFSGHREGDPLFWGDVCRDRIRYVRNFTFNDIDTLAACPLIPYVDPSRPFVRAWFAGSEGANAEAFGRTISEASQDRLVANGGASMMYTHFAYGFWDGKRIEPEFRRLMERLAKLNGWFVTTTELLDYLEQQRGLTTLTSGQRQGLERRWLRSKIRVGHT